MMITRRAVCTGAGAAALVRPRSVRAADEPWAINLSGSAALENTTPAALGFPASSSKVTLSYCYRADAAPAGANNPAFMLTVEGSHVQLQVGHWNDGTGKTYLAANMDQGGGNSGLLTYQSPAGAVLTDGSWHQVVLALDTSALTKQAMLDGALLSNVSQTHNVAFTQEWTSVVDAWVGGFGARGLNFVGDMAQVWLAVGVAPNLNDPAVAGRFWDYGVPMPQKFSGAGAEVISASPEAFPQINLTGPAPFFNRNGGRANWSLWSRADLAPFSYVGAVSTAASDPWEQAIGVAARRI